MSFRKGVCETEKSRLDLRRLRIGRTNMKSLVAVVVILALATASSALPLPGAPCSIKAFNSSLVAEENVKALNDLFKRYENQEYKYAVFDWDNTNMYHDLEETSIAYMLENMLFKIDPNTFYSDLSRGILDNETVVDYWYNNCTSCTYADGQVKANLTELFYRVNSSYSKISEAGYLANNTAFQLAKANNSLPDYYHDFVAVMNYLYYQTASISISPAIVNG